MFGFQARRSHFLAATKPQYVSKAFLRVADFVKQLECQVLIILNTNLTAKHVIDANNVLKKTFDEYQKNRIEAKGDLTLLCKAQLQFINDVLYNDIDSTLVTDPMYLSNRGTLADRGYQFRIYQFDQRYKTDPFHFVESKNTTDGNYTMLPELKKSCNEFYKDINDFYKTIETTDENAPDFLIKQWAIEKNLEEMFNPRPAPLPPQRIATDEALPAASGIEENVNSTRVIYFGCVCIGSLLGLTVGLITADDLNMTEDIIYNINGEDINQGYNVTTAGWCYTGALMLGFTLFLGCMAEICRSKKTVGQMMYDAFVGIMPSASTLSMFSSTWGMMQAPEMYYHADHTSQRLRG
jgi:hypothetical protein